MKHEHIRFRVDLIRILFHVTIQNQRHTSERAVQLTWSNTFHLRLRPHRDLCDENLAEPRVGFEQHEMIRALHRQRSLHARLNFGERVTFLAKVSEKARDEVVQRNAAIECFVVSRSHVDAASLPKLHPATSREFAVCGADGVCVYVVTSCEVACAWQSFGDFEVVTDDTEN